MSSKTASKSLDRPTRALVGLFKLFKAGYELTLPVVQHEGTAAPQKDH